MRCNIVIPSAQLSIMHIESADIDFAFSCCVILRQIKHAHSRADIVELYSEVMLLGIPDMRGKNLSKKKKRRLAITFVL